MTPTPPSASPSQGAHSPEMQHRVTRKRNRVPLSCGPCRHRKLKCNRSSPCDNCLKRGDAPSCTYASSNRRRGQAIDQSPDEMQNRIDRLEGLVMSLMTNGAQAIPPEEIAAAIQRTRPSVAESTDTDEMKGGKDDDSEVERISKTMGVMKVHNDRSFYASEAHWWAILSDIAEVKRYFAEHTKQYDEQVRKVDEAKAAAGSSAATSLLFKGTQKVDRDKILANFPARHVADNLIQRFFETENPAARILHSPTFRREYERHWSRPAETSVVWIGMCFSMMSMAMNSYAIAGDEPAECRGTAVQQCEMYAEYAAQCLVAADFTQPMSYMIEALILYSGAEYARRRDVETGLWMLQGMIVRLAMRMGIHRDSKHFANVNGYMGEMRRRSWSVIRSMDILLSFQCGLPTMISSSNTDVELPTNLYDEEFAPDTATLPAARPTTEITPVAFMIAHTRLTYVLGKIIEFAIAIVQPTYETCMKLDAELREARQQVPKHLLFDPAEGSSLDAANLVMQRYTLDLLYHKSQCVLHRKFLSHARKDSRYAYSRRVCLEACLAMLQHQATLHREGQPGGKLRSVTWAIATSLTTHDFLLAAMIVCLDLYFTAEAEAKNQTNNEMYKWASERREQMFKAIDGAIQIWESLQDTSIEAYKANNILKVMTQKLRNHQILRQQMQQNFSFQRETNGTAADSVAPEHSAAMTLGMMSTGMVPDAMGFFPNRTGLTPQPLGDGFGTLFNNGFGMDNMDFQSAGLDWEGWDTYIQGQNPETLMPQTNNMFDMPGQYSADSAYETSPNTISTNSQPTPSTYNGQDQPISPTTNASGPALPKNELSRGSSNGNANITTMPPRGVNGLPWFGGSWGNSEYS